MTVTAVSVTETACALGRYSLALRPGYHLRQPLRILEAGVLIC